jgi:hypothetical protein
MYGSLVNLSSVALFALSMLLGAPFGSYLASMGIAFSFVPMVCTLASYGGADTKAAGHTAIAFASGYAVIILLVYFAQITAVRLDGLSDQALQILDYRKFGLFFSYDLLGYGLMALSTFFAGLTLKPSTKAEKWLKGLLMVHGVFFISCLILPMLGLFTPEMKGADWIGTVVLEVWCAYFIPVGILAFVFFKNVKTP